MITFNASERARLAAENRIQIPAPGTSFEFERERNEDKALGSCFWDCCDPNLRIKPLTGEDRDAFCLGWGSQREERWATQQIVSWPDDVFQAAVEAGKVTLDDHTAFFCGWNGSALWGNEHVADVLE